MKTNQTQTESTNSISSEELLSSAYAYGEKAYTYILQSQLTADTENRARLIREAAGMIEIVQQNKKEAQRIRLIEAEEQEKKKQPEFSTI